jgi:hypothetical protein
MVNESLCKSLCHILCCLIPSIPGFPVRVNYESPFTAYSAARVCSGAGLGVEVVEG